MKFFLSKFPVFLLLLLLNICCQRPVEKSTKHSEKAEKTATKASVAILGMLHFVSKNNTVSQEETDISNEKTQQEIKSLVSKLKQFQPTKIAVERPYRSEEELNRAYQQFLHGNYELTDEETDQLAFRLAKDLGHEKLYLAYAQVNFDFESAMEFASQHDQQQLVDSIISNARELAQNYDRILAEKSLTAALQYLNSEEAINKNHFGYLLTTQIGDEENRIGTEIVGEWYKSNLNIYRNIQKLANSNDDRILVIYGQGHLKILGQLIEDSRDMELVPIEQFLE